LFVFIVYILSAFAFLPLKSRYMIRKFRSI